MVYAQILLLDSVTFSTIDSSEQERSPTSSRPLGAEGEKEEEKEEEDRDSIYAKTWQAVKLLLKTYSAKLMP